MIFHKTSTSGNDFIIVDRGEFTKLGMTEGDFSREICDKLKNPGADGVIFFSPEDEIFNFSIFNSDGSEAEISGNGMAGLSATLFSMRRSRNPITLRTRAGSRIIRLIDKVGNRFKMEVDMGLPEFNNNKFFPFLTSARKEYDYKGISFFPVSTGNPHAVVILKDYPDDITKLEMSGKLLESGDIFPHRTNVEFVFPIGKTHGKDTPEIEAFFYERGAGITPFSSTGSTAVFAVLHNLGMVGDSIKIRTIENPVLISLNERIFIESYTEIVYKGEYIKGKKCNEL